MKYIENIFKEIDCYRTFYVDLLKDNKNLYFHFNRIIKKDVGDYFVVNFLSLLSDFSNNYSNDIVDYFDSKISITDFAKKFAKFIFSKKNHISKVNLINSLKKHNDISDKEIKNILLNLTYKKEINLFGFGIDDGFYEIKLSHYLVNNGITDKVNIYGLDPFVKDKNPQVEYLDIKQILSKKYPKFDVIIARWVLHHVLPELRWNDFVSCIDKINKDSVVIVVEDSYVSGSINELDKLFYELIYAAADVFANIGFRPSWLLDDGKFCQNFYIKYLNFDDVQNIENATSITFKEKKIYNIGPTFPCQTIICFKT